MKIEVTRDDGTVVDITEGVQIAYDIAYGSMDWGSGFLDTEEMEAVAKLAEVCGFPSYQEALDSVAAKRKEQEQIQERVDRQVKAQRDQEARMRAIAAQQETAQSLRLKGFWTPPWEQA